MKTLTSFILTLSLTLYTLPFLHATPTLEERAPTPVRPFTVAAFESPYPNGQGVTGLNMTARGGNFFLTAAGQKAVLFTTSDGKAYINGPNPQPIYLDTATGALGYANPAPAGAVFITFLHLGRGSQIYLSQQGSYSNGPAAFTWIGSDNSYWFGCPRAPARKGEYQVFKPLTNTIPDLTYCEVFYASAIDA